MKVKLIDIENTRRKYGYVEGMHKVDDVFKVEEDKLFDGALEDENGWTYHKDDLELMDKEELQLEVGKKYVTGLGDIVEVVRITNNIATLSKEIKYENGNDFKTILAYKNGKLERDKEYENDLVKEYIVEETKQTTALDEIARFQTDRGLHLKEYSALDAHANIIEELLESIGYDVDKSKRGQLKEKVVLFVKRLMHKKIAVKNVYKETTTEDKVDAYADIIVFAVGELMKLGYNPEKVLLEVGKEINSRVGTFVNGKFEKDKSEEAMANWYKADFKRCELE